jgi:hypothetical protein
VRQALAKLDPKPKPKLEPLPRAKPYLPGSYMQKKQGVVE